MTGPFWARAERRLLAAPAWYALAAGLLIREAFSFWTGHPYDTEVWIRTAWVVSHGHNPYVSFWPPDPLSIQRQLGTLPSAAYLPFWAVTLSGAFHLYTVVGGGNRFVFYWLIKQPPILGDLLDAWLLYQIVQRWGGDRVRAMGVLWLWLLFPYDIVISAIWGQFDSLIVAVLLAMLLARDSVQRTLLEGFGIFVKWVTIIFVPLEIFRAKGRGRLVAVLALATPATLTVLTFLASGWSITGIESTASSEAGGTGGGMNWVRLVTPALAPWLYPAVSYLWAPVVIIVGWWIAKHYQLVDRAEEMTGMTLLIAVFLLVRDGLNEQYMLYLFPFLVLDFTLFHPSRRSFFEFLWILCFAFLLFNNTLGIWFLTPISPHYLVLSTSLNASHGFGDIRRNSLNLLSVLISITLLQLVVLLLRRKEEWEPWPIGVGRWINARLGRNPPPAAPVSAGRG